MNNNICHQLPNLVKISLNIITINLLHFSISYFWVNEIHKHFGRSIKIINWWKPLIHYFHNNNLLISHNWTNRGKHVLLSENSQTNWVCRKSRHNNFLFSSTKMRELLVNELSHLSVLMFLMESGKFMYWHVWKQLSSIPEQAVFHMLLLTKPQETIIQ